MGNKPQPLDLLLGNVIDGLGLRGKLDAARVVEAWAVLAGPQINAVTERAWVKGEVLHVKITSAAWRSELHLRRRAWRDRLNEQLGADLVAEIMFR